jgi:1-acyl-sn-glycerol-3-phosphate acyltransferase
MPERLTPAYAAVMTIATPVLRTWGRLRVEGLEHLPAAGPVLLAGNHDSYWDPLAVGLAARGRRQIHALAKSSLWGNPVLAKVLDGMGQIPIDRGTGDVAALSRAIEALREGKCIGIFPEGTRTRGRTLRARSGFGRLAQAVPEAEVVCVAVVGTTDIPAFPTRPAVRVRFFRPALGARVDGETPTELSIRLLEEIRGHAPIPPERRRRRGRPAQTAS